MITEAGKRRQKVASPRRPTASAATGAEKTERSNMSVPD